MAITAGQELDSARAAVWQKVIEVLSQEFLHSDDINLIAAGQEVLGMASTNAKLFQMRSRKLQTSEGEEL
jgi:hypothetical protein